MRLQRDLHVVEVQLLKHMYMLHRGLDQCFCRYAAVFRQDFMIERSGVDADTDGDSSLTRRCDHLLHALRPADVSGVDTQGRNALRHRLERKFVVKVDVGHERRLYLPHDAPEILRRRHIGHGNAHNVAARCGELTDLLNGRLRIRRLGIAHGLHGNGRIAPDGDRSNMDLPRPAAFIIWHSEISLLQRYA